MDEKAKSIIARRLLLEAIKDAQSKMFLLPDTVDHSKLQEIISKQLYDSMVDYDILWDIVFECGWIHSHGMHNSPIKPMTDEQKQGLVESAHEKLSRIPTKYELYFPLPEKYPFKGRKLLDNASIVRLSRSDVKVFIDKNPDYMGRLTGHERSFAPSSDTTYLLIKDSGIVRPGGKIVLASRHDPVRIFRLFIALHLATLNIESNEFRRQSFLTRAYDNKKFIANINSTITSESPLGYAEFNNKDNQYITNVNGFYIELLTENIDEDIEKVRIRLTNSLHWYFEFKNTNDINLKIVYLVSAIDSLFGFSEKDYIPTVRDIAPIIAEANAIDYKQKAKIIETVQKLYKLRNDVIHGRKEIQSYRRIEDKERRHNQSVLDSVELNYQHYLAKQVNMYDKSI